MMRTATYISSRRAILVRTLPSDMPPTIPSCRRQSALPSTVAARCSCLFLGNSYCFPLRRMLQLGSCRNRQSMPSSCSPLLSLVRYRKADLNLPKRENSIAAPKAKEKWMLHLGCIPSFASSFKWSTFELGDHVVTNPCCRHHDTCQVQGLMAAMRRLRRSSAPPLSWP